MTDKPMDFDPRHERCPLCGGAIHLWGAKTRGPHSFTYDRCAGCDFAFVNPRPTLASLERYYRSAENGHAQSSSSAIDARDNPGDWERTAISEMLSAREGPGRFLDVGAGGGVFSLAALRAGLKVTALELDADDAARLGTLTGVEVVVTPFERFDPAPGSYDYILMSHVLEHAHDPALWVKNASRLLSTGGVLAICLPHFNSIYRLMGGTMDPYFFPPEHLNHFNTKSLGRLCRREGLTRARSYSLGRFPDNVITRRIKMPDVVSRAVRFATAGASSAVEKIARATGAGAVLFMLARKSENSPTPSEQIS